MPGSSFCKQKVGASDTKLAPTMVRAWGLEPQRREAREPKGDVTSVTNSYSVVIAPFSNSSRSLNISKSL